MGLKITYVHDEVCSRQGQEVVVRPDSIDGVAWMRTPICEETMAELKRVTVEKY